MNILIADDERPARNRLRHLLNQSDSEIELISEVENGDQVLELCETLNPDVVLLDIRMPGKSGLDVCKQLSTFHCPPAVVIVSAYDEHALQAFDAHAVDYVLKPVHQQRLDSALRKAVMFRKGGNFSNQSLSDNPRQREHLSIKDRDTVYRVPVSEIIYFKAEQKYVLVRTDKFELLSSESLKTLETEFQGLFMRVHRNALVACKYITSLEKQSNGKCYIHFTGTDEKIEISRRHLPRARQWLKINGNQGVA